MTTYYVSPDGDDLAVGSELAPWRTAHRANLDLANGDTLIFKDTTPSNPVRGRMVLAVDNLTLSWSTDGRPEYLSAGADLSVGGSWDRVDGIAGNDKNLMLQSWTTATDAVSWAETLGGTGTINREATENIYGTYCARFNVDAAGIDLTMLIQGINLAADSVTTFNYIHKDSTGHTAQCAIRDQTDNFYLQADGSWDAAQYKFTLTESATWTTYPVSFTPRNTGSYQTYFWAKDANAVHYFQGIEISIQASWSEYTADVYKTNMHHSAASGAPGIGLHKCTKSEWEVNGINALTCPVKAASLGAIAAGQYYWDSTAKAYYYKLQDGEVITDLHFEAGIYDSVLTSARTGTKYIGIVAALSRYENIVNSGGTATHYSVRSTRSNRYGAADSGGAVVRWVDCEFDHNSTYAYEVNASNGYLCSSATSVLIGCKSHSNGDDGFQKYGDNATLTLWGCLAYGNMSQQCTNTAGTGGAMTVIGCTFVANDTVGNTTDPNAQVLYDKTVAETATYVGNIIVMDRPVSPGVKIAEADTPAQLTASHNCCVDLSGTATAANAVYTTTSSVLSNPLFIDSNNGDFNLLASSPCIGAGYARWWGAGARPSGANGQPFPDFDIDIGAAPSGHGVFYPK